MKAFLGRVWGIVKHWAKAEVAFLLPILGEYAFGALTRLGDASAGEQVLSVLIYAILAVWAVPNGPKPEPTV